MNLALLSKEEKDDMERYRADCNRRRYKAMNSGVANSIMRTLSAKGKREFIYKINKAKGYKFI